jgi:hypothetical protein
LSLVDGYNLPMGIIALVAESKDPNITEIPPNLTNPICIGTSSLLTAVGDTRDQTFGSNDTYPIPLEQSISPSFVESWCPFPLLLLPPQKPGDGVYPFSDQYSHLVFRHVRNGTSLNTAAPATTTHLTSASQASTRLKQKRSVQTPTVMHTTIRAVPLYFLKEWALKWCFVQAAEVPTFSTCLGTKCGRLPRRAM